MNYKFSMIVVLLLASLMAGCSSGTATPTLEAAAGDGTAKPQAEVVSAEAFVVPVKKADLTFEVTGRVLEVLVQEGDKVKKGDVLARLDDSVAQAGLTEAESNLASQLANVAKSEAELAKTKAGPTAEEIASKEAELARVEAVLAEKLSGPTPEQIAKAEAAVTTSRAELKRELAGNRQEDIQKQAAIVLQKESIVREKQSDYDRVRYGDPKDVMVVGTALQGATLDYEAAQVDYDRLVKGSTDEDIAIKQAQVAQQQAGLAEVLAGATAEQIAQSQADVARVEAELAKLVAGATKEDIAVAQAGVDIAKAAVDYAKSQIAKTKTELTRYQLVAPFDGVVGLIKIEAGEMFQGTGDKAITMGDFSKWQIETDDLTEIDVVNVKAGRSVNVKVDALPDEKFEGKVVRVNPRSETKAGDVTYTVLLDITSGDSSKLMWGMTTFVDIAVK